MNVLLIQFRTDQSAPHELQCVVRHAGIEQDEITLLQPLVSPADVSRHRASQYDAIIVGGSGEYNLPQSTPELRKSIDGIRPLLDDAVAADQPLLGLCFGHQLLAQHLGGTVAHLPGDPAVGTHTVTVNEVGQEDPLYAGLPESFAAQHGHKDAVMTLPRGATVLSTTPHDPHASYRVGRRAYGLQYHGELDQEDLLFRMRLYPSYVAGKTEEELRALFRPTPHAPALLRNFRSIIHEYRN